MELMEDYNAAENERLYRKAKEKAGQIRGFYINLCLYCIIIPVLIFINLTYSPEYYWFLFSMLGWGLGLTFHGMDVFDWNPVLGKKWENRKIKEIMEKERRNEQQNSNI